MLNPKPSANAWTSISGSVDRGQPHQPHPISEVGSDPPGRLHTQRGLPRAARTGQGHQPSPSQRLQHPVQVVVPADERCQPQRQVPRRPNVRIRPRDGAGGCRDRGDGGVLPQDLLHQSAQLPGRVQAQLVGQYLPGPGVHLQRVGLPPGVEQPGHQLPDQPLPGRRPGDDRFQVGDQLLVAAQRQHPFGPLGDRGEPQLDQPGGLHRRPRFAREVHERLGPPLRQRRVIEADRLVRGPGAAGPIDRRGEAVHVDAGRVHVQAVPGALPGQELPAAGRGQRATHLRHPGLQRVHRVNRLIPVRPQLLDERGVGDHPPRGQRQDRHQGAFTPPGQAHRAGVHHHLERSQQTKVHGRTDRLTGQPRVTHR